jgi:PAS domain S-box-containing protein
MGLPDIERALQQAAERLQILAESSHQFASIRSVNELIETVARRLGDVVGEGCAVRLLAREGDVFQAGGAITFHPDPAIMAEARELAESQPLRLGEGVTGRVAQTGEALLLPVITTAQILAQTPLEYHPMVKRLAISSLLVVPLKAGGRVIGVISMSRRDPRRPFTIEDQRLVQDVADRAALAIENALLVAELEERVAARTAALERTNRELQTLREGLESVVAARTGDLIAANTALRRSEARFRRLTDSGIIGITVSDLSGRILEANDAFLAILGYSRDEFLAGKVNRATINHAQRERTDAGPLSSLRSAGVAGPWEKILVRKDGQHVPVLVGAAKIDESSDETIAFVLDLSDRARAETEARESEARKAAVMETALDAIVLMDSEGRVTDFNPAAERIFGYTRDEVVGSRLAEVLIPPRRGVRHDEALERYLATGEGSITGRDVEVVGRTKSGSEFPAEVSVVRIRSGGAAAFTGTIRDITERRQAAEAELLQAEKEAVEASNRELEAFSYSVAHDLRAPLRAIVGFSGVLLLDHGDELTAEAKANLDRIVAAGERMGHIIDALLSLARLSRAEVRRENVELTETARSVMQQLRASEPGRSVDFVAMDGLTARGDPALLRTVLENLLGNAWKFTRNRPQARIELGSSLVPDGLAYYVRDNGAGFPMTYAARLFVPFQRLHSTDEFEGHGVGLATVQRIISRHGGRVWAEGAENGGATFYFTLPELATTRMTSRMPTE